MSNNLPVITDQIWPVPSNCTPIHEWRAKGEVTPYEIWAKNENGSLFVFEQKAKGRGPQSAPRKYHNWTVREASQQEIKLLAQMS
jgi:hypothetical protein